MNGTRILSPEQAEALLNQAGSDDSPARVRAYDPTRRERIVPGRLHTFDIINERFARHFRVGLFNLIRRSADIVVQEVTTQTYGEFTRGLSTPANLNLVSLQPLRGNALVVFPPSLIYLVVDNLFGGDGQFVTTGERSDFTHTEQRIIQRLLQIALTSYRVGWERIHPLEPEFQRAETQVKFANITGNNDDFVVITRFRVEVGAFGSDFHIAIPYAMLEPIRDLLSGPLHTKDPQEEQQRKQQLAAEVEHTQVRLTAEFLRLEHTLGKLLHLQVGDVLPIDLPAQVEACVDKVPVFSCAYGRVEDRIALRVTDLINHVPTPFHRNQDS